MKNLAFLGSDHAGITLLAPLEKILHEKNFHTTIFSPKNLLGDYPDFAAAVCQNLRPFFTAPDPKSAQKILGILVCGSGIGISIAANRFPFVRAALCSDVISARLSRAHNDANVLCLGARFCTDFVAGEILEAFLSTDFEYGRHENRVKKLADLGSSRV